MVVLETCDHLDLRLEPEEHVVVFIRFDHEWFAFARMRVDSEIVQHAADDKGWVTSQFAQDPGGHGGGGGLAVRPGNGNPHFVFHQATKEVGTFVHRDARTLRGFDLGVVVRYRRGAYHPIGSRQIARMVSHEHLRTSLANFIGKGSHRAVRAAHLISALQQEAGDGGKTASPDANEMDVCHDRS